MYCLNYNITQFQITEELEKTTLKLNDSNERIKQMNKKIAEYENNIDNLQQQVNNGKYKKLKLISIKT